MLGIEHALDGLPAPAPARTRHGRLYFIGGIPLVLLSGQAVAEQVLADEGSA